MPDQPLRQRLRRHYRRLRVALILRHALRASAVAVAAIALAVALGVTLPLHPGTAWARVLAAALASGIGLAFALRGLRRALPGFDAYLERIERRIPEIRSWLRNALDLEGRPAPGTSAELSGALTRETARRLERVALDAHTPPIEPRRPVLVIGAAFVVVIALALVAPQRASRAWATLWNPSAAAPPVRLEVQPGSVRLPPGATLAVRARVWGTRERPRLLRDGEPATAPSLEGTGPEDERSWRFDLTQLTRGQDYRVRVAGIESPIYHIALAGEPQAVSFEVEYRAPAYARLPVQNGAATRGDLSALRGSRARVEALFDRDLEGIEARWVPSASGSAGMDAAGGALAPWTALTPRRWRGEIAIDREGEYELRARAGTRQGVGGESRFRYRIHPLPDAPPVLVVRVPQGDVDLPAGQQVALEVLGQDDLGLSELRLQYRRDPDSPWTTVPLARFAGRPREAEVGQRWDASPLGLLPGQSASFRLELLDDNVLDGPGRALSQVFELRFPSLADLYDRIDERQGSAQKTLEQVAERARELQKTLDKLSRETRPSPTQSPAFERSEELKAALDRQQQLAESTEKAAQQLRESLEMAQEREAFNEQLMRNLREISELVQQIQSQDFKEALRRMREALEKLDRRELDRTLPEWRLQNQELLRNLERTAELLRQIREEERLAALSQRAEELKALQDQLNREREQQSDSPQRERREDTPQRDQAGERGLNQRQEEAAGETEELSRDVETQAQESSSADEKETLRKAAEKLAPQASQQQRQAARSSGSSGSQSGQQASQSLESAAKALKETLSKHQQGRQSLDLAAVRRAAQDLLSLQRETQDNLESGDPQRERADRQADLSEGVARVADSLSALAKHTPFIKPKLAESMGRAMSELSNSAKMLDSGNRPGGEQSGKRASEALNQAVLELRETEGGMCDKPGQGPGGQQPSPGQLMREMSDQQGKLNDRARRLTQQMSEQLRNSAGDQEELRRLSEEQRRIREQLEQLERDEEARRRLLGRLDETAREMKEVEQQLREGAPDGELLGQRQQHILSRLLDAQRSLNRQDFDPERESRPGEDVARRSPAELPADLLRETDRLRLDLLKAEADRYPTQYRAYVEAYLRSLNGSGR